MFQKKKESKFRNVESLCALGHSHASKLEGAVCAMLQLRQRAGEIEIIQIQDYVKLTLAEIVYIPDFKCMDLKNKSFFWAEAKGSFVSERWPTIKKLWKFYGPGKLEIWGGSYSRLNVIEEIVPHGS